MNIKNNFVNELRYFPEISRERATNYARIIAQYIFIYHRLFSAGFYKVSKEGQRIDEVDFFC